MRRETSDIIAEVGLFSAIVIIVLLKLTGIITVSWIWLFSPVWMILIVGGALIMSIVIIRIIRGLIELAKENKENERN